MKSSSGFRILVFTLGLTCCFPLSGLASDASKPIPRDNSGRQLAVAVPRDVEAADHAPDSQFDDSTRRLQFAPTLDQSLQPQGLSDSESLSGGFRGRVLSTAPAPSELPPQVKQAVETSTEVLESISRSATKQAGDLGMWVSLLWRNLNGTPILTPNSPILAPAPESFAKALTSSARAPFGP